MSSFRKAVLASLWVLASAGAFAQTVSAKYPGVGRNATAKEIAAWDIDVRPDFKGLPPGSGSVAQGQNIWESKCAHCHGIFGESTEVFTPLVGGTTAKDIETGRVANLKRDDYPGRTTMMKLATVSTLWDYINRAMPWTAPKSLKTDEVYAVTAFLLSLANVVPEDYTLSDKNIAEVQKRMPNRNGMTTAHSMWPGPEFKGVKTADTRNVACMKNCVPEANVGSFLPDFARNAHGNLAEQNRLVGAQHGVDTTRPEGAAAGMPAPVVVAKSAEPARPETTSKPDNASAASHKAALALTQKFSCNACHAQDKKLVGPAFADIAKKYPGKADYLASKIKSGGSGVWGPIPMPPQTLSDADAKTLADWLAAGAGK